MENHTLSPCLDQYWAECYARASRNVNYKASLDSFREFEDRREHKNCSARAAYKRHDLVPLFASYWDTTVRPKRSKPACAAYCNLKLHQKPESYSQATYYSSSSDDDDVEDSVTEMALQSKAAASAADEPVVATTTAVPEGVSHNPSGFRFDVDMLDHSAKLDHYDTLIMPAILHAESADAPPNDDEYDVVSVEERSVDTRTVAPLDWEKCLSDIFMFKWFPKAEGLTRVPLDPVSGPLTIVGEQVEPSGPLTIVTDPDPRLPASQDEGEGGEESDSEDSGVESELEIEDVGAEIQEEFEDTTALPPPPADEEADEVPDVPPPTAADTEGVELPAELDATDLDSEVAEFGEARRLSYSASHYHVNPTLKPFEVDAELSSDSDEDTFAHTAYRHKALPVVFGEYAVHVDELASKAQFSRIPTFDRWAKGKYPDLDLNVKKPIDTINHANNWYARAEARFRSVPNFLNGVQKSLYDDEHDEYARLVRAAEYQMKRNPTLLRSRTHPELLKTLDAHFGYAEGKALPQDRLKRALKKFNLKRVEKELQKRYREYEASQGVIPVGGARSDSVTAVYGRWKADYNSLKNSPPSNIKEANKKASQLAKRAKTILKAIKEAPASAKLVSDAARIYYAAAAMCACERDPISSESGAHCFSCGKQSHDRFISNAEVSLKRKLRKKKGIVGAYDSKRLETLSAPELKAILRDLGSKTGRSKRGLSSGRAKKIKKKIEALLNEDAEVERIMTSSSSDEDAEVERLMSGNSKYESDSYSSSSGSDSEFDSSDSESFSGATAATSTQWQKTAVHNFFAHPFSFYPAKSRFYERGSVPNEYLEYAHASLRLADAGKLAQVEKFDAWMERVNGVKADRRAPLDPKNAFVHWYASAPAFRRNMNGLINDPYVAFGEALFNPAKRRLAGHFKTLEKQKFKLEAIRDKLQTLSRKLPEKKAELTRAQKLPEQYRKCKAEFDQLKGVAPAAATTPSSEEESSDEDDTSNSNSAYHSFASATGTEGGSESYRRIRAMVTEINTFLEQNNAEFTQIQSAYRDANANVETSTKQKASDYKIMKRRISAPAKKMSKKFAAKIKEYEGEERKMQKKYDSIVGDLARLGKITKKLERNLERCKNAVNRLTRKSLSADTADFKAESGGLGGKLRRGGRAVKSRLSKSSAPYTIVYTEGANKLQAQSKAAYASASLITRHYPEYVKRANALAAQGARQKKIIRIPTFSEYMQSKYNNAEWAEHDDAQCFVAWSMSGERRRDRNGALHPSEQYYGSRDSAVELIERLGKSRMYASGLRDRLSKTLKMTGVKNPFKRLTASERPLVNKLPTELSGKIEDVIIYMRTLVGGIRRGNVDAELTVRMARVLRLYSLSMLEVWRERYYVPPKDISASRISARWDRLRASNTPRRLVLNSAREWIRSKKFAPDTPDSPELELMLDALTAFEDNERMSTPVGMENASEHLANAIAYVATMASDQEPLTNFKRYLDIGRLPDNLWKLQPTSFTASGRTVRRTPEFIEMGIADRVGKMVQGQDPLFSQESGSLGLFNEYTESLKKMLKLRQFVKLMRMYPREFSEAGAKYWIGDLLRERKDITYELTASLKEFEFADNDRPSVDTFNRNALVEFMRFVWLIVALSKRPETRNFFIGSAFGKAETPTSTIASARRDLREVATKRFPSIDHMDTKCQIEAYQAFSSALQRSDVSMALAHLNEHPEVLSMLSKHTPRLVASLSRMLKN